jgi:hypothetical protein
VTKYIVVHSLYSDADGGRFYRGQEIELTGQEEKRAVDLGSVAKPSSAAAKTASAEAAALDQPRSDNPHASMSDVPGLKGDELRAAGDAPPETGTPAAAEQPTLEP